MTESEESIAEAMKKDGWKKQFVAGEPRLSEAVQLYKEAGFEVILRDMPPVKASAENTKCGSETTCLTCFEGFERDYKIIHAYPVVTQNELFPAAVRVGHLLNSW